MLLKVTVTCPAAASFKPGSVQVLVVRSTAVESVRLAEVVQVLYPVTTPQADPNYTSIEPPA